jgi:putative Holliday junction resolvase
MIEAAASHTCSSFSLLGVKSLGIDYGLVRTGIAITVGYNPKPLAILSNLNTTQLCQEIVRRVETENAQQIVVGLPLHKNGTVAEQTILTREFVQQLVCSIYASFGPAGEEKEATLESGALFTAIPIFLWDERYTSKEAEARLRARNPKKNFGSLQGELDADAACIILEHFYADSGKGAERVQVPQHDPALLQVVQEAWALQCEERSELLKEKQRARQDGIHINAKQVAIERARILDAKLEIQYGPKKGKKKRRR